MGRCRMSCSHIKRLLRITYLAPRISRTCSEDQRWHIGCLYLLSTTLRSRLRISDRLLDIRTTHLDGRQYRFRRSTRVPASTKATSSHRRRCQRHPLNHILRALLRRRRFRNRSSTVVSMGMLRRWVVWECMGRTRSRLAVCRRLYLVLCPSHRSRLVWRLPLRRSPTHHRLQVTRLSLLRTWREGRAMWRMTQARCRPTLTRIRGGIRWRVWRGVIVALRVIGVRLRRMARSRVKITTRLGGAVCE